jgi:hypothetical protein
LYPPAATRRAVMMPKTARMAGMKDGEVPYFKLKIETTIMLSDIKKNYMS